MNELQLVFNGSRLLEKRKAFGKKQVEVAEFLTITPQSYGEMERGQITPSSPNLAKLCILFGCRIEEFFDIPAKYFAKT